MMLWPRPSEDQLRSLYDAHYYKNPSQSDDPNGELVGYMDYLRDKPLRQIDLRRVLRMVRTFLHVRSGAAPSLLEIGSGLGFLLEEARRHGYDVEGVEISRFACEYMRREYDFPVHLGDLAEVQPLRESYDVCFMLDLIEHLLSPRKTLARVSQLLRPGGLCVLGTMDCDSFVSRMLGKRMEDFRRIREHMFFFNRRTIRMFLEQFGLDVLFVRSFGLTFELGPLMDRLGLTFPGAFRRIRALIHPSSLLGKRLYVNPGVKILVIARRNRRV